MGTRYEARRIQALEYTEAYGAATMALNSFVWGLQCIHGTLRDACAPAGFEFPFTLAVACLRECEEPWREPGVSAMPFNPYVYPPECFR